MVKYRDHLHFDFVNGNRCKMEFVVQGTDFDELDYVKKIRD